MRLSRDEAGSRQLADRLEEEIRRRILPPGSKLESSRALSEKFNLDRNVVRAALDILAERKLVVSLPRKGIYVNPELLSLGRPELYVFTYGGLTPSYLEVALQLLARREYQREFNVTLRYASWEEINLETFENEICKARAAHPGLLLLGSSYIDAEKIAMLRRYEVPFLIVGELHHPVAGEPFNQIFEQFAAKGLEIGKFFAAGAFQEIAYFRFPDAMLDFETSYRMLIRSQAAAAGKRYCEIPLGFNPESGRNDSAWQEKAVYDLFASGARPDLLHFFDSVDVAGIQRVLDRFQLRIPEDVNLLVYRQLVIHPVPGIYLIDPDYSRFSEEAFRLIERCARGEFIGANDLTGFMRYEIEPYSPINS